MVGDRISNLIISLKNASAVKKDEVVFSKTKLVESILKLLKDKKYIESYNEKDNEFVITLSYREDETPVISDVKRVSKQSQRVYKQAKEINPVKNGYGMAVISTPQGVMSDEEARKSNVGGEVLFEIW